MLIIVKFYNLKLLSTILIIGLGILVYSNALFCPFHFDDEYYIVNNFAIKNIQNLLNIWAICPCRFITFFSLALNYHFHRLDVLGFHLFNIAVHLGSAILVWWLTLLTLSTPAVKEDKITRHAGLIALFAGLVFVSHPVQVEGVTYIWQRATAMAAFFYLASLCLYVKSRLSRSNQSTYYIFSLVTAVMAMFTKENTITLPLMVLLYEFCFLKDKGSMNWQYIFPFLLTILIIPLTILFFKSNRFQEIRGVVEGPQGISPADYLLTQFRVMATYIRLVFLPLNLNLDYDYPIYKNFSAPSVFFSFLFLMTILYSAKRLFLKYRLVSFSIFWFFLALLPDSSILPLEDVIFEHRLYLALVGFSMFMAGSMYYLFGKKSIKTMVIILTMIMACNSFLTYQRNQVWRDKLTLWDDAVGKSPHKARPYNNRGRIYYDQGDIPRAMSDFNKAIEIKPQYADPYINRGRIYYDQGKLTQALSDYNKAIEINPYAEAYNNRGNVFDEQGNFTQAVLDYDKAIELKPDYAQAYYNHGSAFGRHGHLTQAISDFTKAIELNPGYAQAYNNRAVTYFMIKEYEKAWGDARRAQALGAPVNPGFISALKKVIPPRRGIPSVGGASGQDI